MKVEVKLKDGTTVAWFESRGAVKDLIRREPDALEGRPSEASDGPRRSKRSVRCLVRWHPQAMEMEVGHFQWLNRSSIAFVRELTAAECEEFTRLFAPPEAEPAPDGMVARKL